MNFLDYIWWLWALTCTKTQRGKLNANTTVEEKDYWVANLKVTRFGKPFQVKCDASGVAIGAVLCKEDKPVAYFSEKMNDAKHKYSSYDKELYAIVQILKHWRHYLMPKEFLLYSDNHALQYIMQ